MGKITKSYAELVFSKDVMQERLSSQTFDSYMKLLNQGGQLDETISLDISRAVKEWAIEQGVTHLLIGFNLSVLVLQKSMMLLSIMVDKVKL